ncbi:hypothetical protein DERP_005846 [Dermatophagoides pteronyssinus]|uniref:Uncharacterized protein n=1 Tax=Dermatophagoides pteronyssinus TaxID=6956 RepID=A0ABQ8JAF1_DERPT|nr:hypothetical protein DERP_005846 [Dermatophagoides pteronyssinus]
MSIDTILIIFPSSNFLTRNNAYDGTSLLAPALCVRRNNRTRRVADAEKINKNQKMIMIEIIIVFDIIDFIVVFEFDLRLSLQLSNDVAVFKCIRLRHNSSTNRECLFFLLLTYSTKKEKNNTHMLLLQLGLGVLNSEGLSPPQLEFNGDREPDSRRCIYLGSPGTANEYFRLTDTFARVILVVNVVGMEANGVAVNVNDDDIILKKNNAISMCNFVN